MAHKMKRIRAVAIVLQDDMVLLVHRINAGKEYWVFPGGGVEASETIEEAVSREVNEEASLQVCIEKLLYHHILDDDSEQFFYLCRYLSGEVHLRVDTNEAQHMREVEGELYEPLWCNISQLKDLLVYPLEIRDWFLKDYETGFNNPPKEATLRVSDLREHR